MTKTITLAQGNGGEENNELIKKVFYKAFKNEILERSDVCYSQSSYIVYMIWTVVTSNR